MIARRDTIALAIRATQEKINKGYRRGIRFYDTTNEHQRAVDDRLNGMIADEPKILETLKQLHARV